MGISSEKFIDLTAIILIYIALKGKWQYKLSLSYLKEHLKLYVNFLYNYSISCLVFEINRLILINSSVHSAILDMHSICICHK